MQLSLWIAIGVAAAALAALLALVETRRTRFVILAAVGGPVLIGLILYYGYFLLFPGD